MQNEPVMWVTMAMSVIRSGLLLLLSLGVFALTQGQLDAVFQFLAVLLPFIDFAASAYIRSRVKPVAKLIAEQQALSKSNVR